MRIGVIGQGYVGQTVAFFASRSFDVTGFDLNPDLVAELNAGVSRIEGLDKQMLVDALSSKSYRATTDASDLDGSDVVVIAVPTPLTPDRKPDLSYIQSACEVIGKNVKNDGLIINESTSFPGTVRKFIKPTIEKFAPHSKHLYAVSPERVDPGRTDWNQLNTSRLYSGLTEEASLKTAEFYGSFCNNLVKVSAPEVAEAAKLFENSFRQVNIALVNEFAQIANALGISVRETLDAANTKPYGFMKFDPSAGVGGHCIPVDPSYLAESAREHGVTASFIELANEVNLRMGSYIVERVQKDNGGSLKGKSVQIVGVAYKPNVADVRETPAEEIYKELVNAGAIVTWFDPLVGKWKEGKSDKPQGEIAIVVTRHGNLDETEILKGFKYVFDTSGKIKGATQL